MVDSASGMQYLRALVGAPPVEGMHALLGLEVLDVADGQCTVQGRPGPQFYNHQGRVHGGYLATVIDTALGLAVQTKVPRGTGFGTVEISVNYIRKLDADTVKIRCVGTVLHAGRTMLTAEAKVYGSDDKLYAHGTGTFLVYPK